MSVGSIENFASCPLDSSEMELPFAAAAVAVVMSALMMLAFAAVKANFLDC